MVIKGLSLLYSRRIVAIFAALFIKWSGSLMSNLRENPIIETHLQVVSQKTPSRLTQLSLPGLALDASFMF